MRNKSVIFIDDEANIFFKEIKKPEEFIKIYQDIIMQLYNDGYRTFYSDARRGFNEQVVLEAICKSKDVYSDIRFVAIAECKEEHDEYINEENNFISIAMPYNENEYILANCSKMIVATIVDKRELTELCNLLYTIKVGNMKLLIFESDF